MAGGHSTRVLVIIMLLVAVLGAAGWFGYSMLRGQRSEAAVEAAADFLKATREKDKVALRDLLPPEFADQLEDEDFDAFWGAIGKGWKYDDRRVEDDRITDTYRISANDAQTAEFALRNPTTLQDAEVLVTFTMGKSDSEGAVELVWLDGAWRIARYEDSTYDEKYTFWDEGEDAKDLLEEFLKTAPLGTAPTLSEEQINGVPANHPSIDGENPDVAGGDAPPLTPEQLGEGQLPSGHAPLTTPDVSTPQAYVDSYCRALVAADYYTAYTLLPADKRKAYGSEEAFAAQLAGYGFSSYSIDDSTVDPLSGTATVWCTLDSAGGAIRYVWTLEEQSKGTWVATGRELNME